MARVTQRDIIETITELRLAAQELRGSAQKESENWPLGIVPMSKSHLFSLAEFLDTAANELTGLIPDDVLPPLKQE